MNISARCRNQFVRAIAQLLVMFGLIFMTASAFAAGVPDYMTPDSHATPQNAPILAAFSVPLAVTVFDIDNLPVPDVTVTFTAPASGASGTFPNGQTSISATTDASGVASTGFTANATAGAYIVSANASGKSAGFSLTNTVSPGTPYNAIPAVNTTPQHVPLNTATKYALSVRIVDIANIAMANTTVRFAAPGSDAGGTFSNGQATIDVTTDVNGLATTIFSANGTTGSYNVTATAIDAILVPHPTTVFALTNYASSPASAVVTGNASPQRAALGAAFASSLRAQITDTYGYPVANTTVRFVAPGSGASGVFPGNLTTIDIPTDASGIATTTFTANNNAGNYSVVATATQGATPSTTFALYNYVPLQGPQYPPPGTLTFDPGAVSDGGVGKTGGTTWTISNVSLATTDTVYWGAKDKMVKLSFVDSGYSRSGEILTYQPALSDLPNGKAVWSGQTILGATPIYTRFTLTVKAADNTTPLPLADGYGLGLPTDVGAVLRVTSGLQFKANLLYEASTSSSTGFTPAYEFYNNNHQYYGAPSSSAYSSVDFAYYWENTPPTISALPGQFLPLNTAGGPYTFSVGDNETAPGNLTLSATSSDTALLPNTAITFGGSGADRTVSVAPTAGQSGTSTVTITVSDSVATTSTSFVLTVNSPPTISAITNKLIQQSTTGGPYAVTIADNETAAGSLQLSATSSNTTLLPNNAITFGGNGADRTVSVTPVAGQSGTTTVTVTVTDSAFGTASATFLLTVNAPPKLNFNNPLTVNVGSSASITNTLLQATDTESAADKITFTLNGTTHNGTLKLGAATLSAGATFTMQDINNNLLSYTAGSSCEVSDDFQFSVTDDNGGMYVDGQFSSFSFRITINHPNRPPTVPESTSINVPLGNTHTGSLQASDPDAVCITPTYTFSIESNGSHGTATITNPATGAFSYTPNPGYAGADTFVYTVSDGIASSGQGTVNVTVANQAPTAHAGSGSTTEGIALTGTLTASDPDLPAQALTYAIATNSAKGTAVITNAATGAFTYTSNANAIGDDSFTFTANDGSLTSAPATFSVSIRPVIKVGDIIVSNQKAQGNTPPPPTLICVRPQSGQQAVISTGDKFTDLYGVALEKNGTILVLDGTNGLLRVNPQTGVQSVVTVAATFGMAIGLAVESDGNILVGSQNGLFRIDPATGQTLTTFSGTNLDFPAGVTVGADGQIYVGDVGGFSQPPKESQIIRIDPVSGTQTVLSTGGSLAAPAGLVVNSAGDVFAADGPMGTNNIIEVSHTLAQSTFATGGDLASPSGIALLNGNFVVTSNGNNKLVQVSSANGTQTVLAADGYLLKPFGIAVVDAPPGISAISDQLIQQGSVGGPYAFTIGDTETPLDALVLSATSGNTTLLPNNAITFGGSGANRTVTVTPVAGQHGTSLVTITVTDGAAVSAGSSFTLTVNAPPKLNFNGPLTVNAGNSATITNTLLQASDAESTPDKITFTIASQNGGTTHNGTLILGSTPLASGSTFTMQDINNNLLSYAANSTCEVSDNFQFSVTDGNGGMYVDGQYSSFSFPITIGHPNRPPTVSAKTTVGVPLGTTYSGQLQASDPDSACVTPTFSFRILSDPLNGTATITNGATGTFTYTPDPGFSGKDTFTYTVNDGVADAASAGQMVLNVTNQAPTAHAATGTTVEGTPLTGTLTASDPDLPPQALTYAIATNGAKGTAVITNAATGAFTYTPNANAIGDDSFTFTANDGFLSSATATFSVTIRPVIKVGDIIVSNQKAQGNTPPPPTLICVRPQSGQQAVISTGDKFTDLYGVALEKNGNILVLDGTNGLLRVNPQSGVQSVVASAAPFGMAIGLAVEPTGTILVGSQNGLFRIDPATGQTLTTFSGTNIDFPAGVTVGADGQIYVGDVGAFAQKPSQILRIDPVSGTQTVLSTGGSLAVPSGLVVNSAGDVFAADGPMGTNNIIEVSHTLAQSTFATGGNLASPSGIALLNGNFVVTSNGNNKLVQVSSADGSQTVLAADGYLLKPFGIAVVTLDPPVAAVATNVTVSGFTAQWSAVSGATGYRLDVATDGAFSNFVTNLNNANVGNATSHDVSGLLAGTTYYYRVRAYNASGQSSDSNTITVSTNATLSVTILPATSGSNTVTSVPGGISCHTDSSAGCSADFTGGSSVTLVPTAAWNYVLTGWSGACSQSPCTILMDQARGATATFAPNLTVKLAGATPTYYSTLADAYAVAAAGSSATIQAQAFTFYETLLFGAPVTVTLEGGKDGAFGPSPGFTAIKGSLKIKGGKVIGNRIKIQ